MTKTLSKEFMATLEISVVSRKVKEKTRFYKADYIKCADTMEEALDQFCKFLLKEYFVLVEKNSDKQIFYVITCYKHMHEFFDKNMYIDQLRNYLAEMNSTLILKEVD